MSVVAVLVGGGEGKPKLRPLATFHMRRLNIYMMRLFCCILEAKETLPENGQEGQG